MEPQTSLLIQKPQTSSKTQNDIPILPYFKSSTTSTDQTIKISQCNMKLIQPTKYKSDDLPENFSMRFTDSKSEDCPENENPRSESGLSWDHNHVQFGDGAACWRKSFRMR
ncbi:hypothetical protein M758_4G164100 [Ceratodon purpureus]|nr:hypothetical protein M758_4G164100 [Ceratodon purpureus]